MGDTGKKQVPLRLSAKLYNAIAAWAEDDFRSVNGQIEYLLTECVRQRKKNGRYVSEELDVPPELDIYNAEGGRRKDRRRKGRCRFAALRWHNDAPFRVSASGCVWEWRAE